MTRSRRASRRSSSSASRTTSTSTPPRTRPPSPTRTSRSTTSSCSSPRRATSSTPTSRPPSSATSRPATATPASTPPPTPSTRGRGTARSRRLLPQPPGRHATATSTSRTATSPPRPASRPPGRARTSGTTSSPRSARSSAATARIADYSPRDSDVHVLATVDEATYDEDDDNAAADDHPVAWCSNFDGGRVWYTALGHTQASFTEPDFLGHLLGGIRTAAGDGPADCGEPRQATPSENDFEMITLDDDTRARWSSPWPATAASSTSSASPAGQRDQGGRHRPDRRHDPRLERAGERPAGHPAGPELRPEQLGLRRLHAAARQLDRDARLPVHDAGRHAEHRRRSRSSSTGRTSASSAATRPARSRSAWTAASTSSTGDNTNPFDSSASRRPTSGRAARSGTPSARRPTRTA